MIIAETIRGIKDAVSEARAGGQSVALVPTMGALHEGHASLMRAAVSRCGFVVVSIFVNPAQFGPGEDYDCYPKTPEKDLEFCRSEGVHAVFMPAAEELYPGEQLTWVEVGKISEPLCGRTRPGHFRGVATVCAKLFNIVAPDEAFFGWKDAQQGLVVRRMAADLNMPLEIILCPTVRDPDGLALSSRNRYLSVDQRKDALYIYRALCECRRLFESGTRDCSVLRTKMQEVLSGSSLATEYISVADPESLEELDEVRGRALAAIAATAGPARLIDNILLDAGGAS